MKLFWVAGPHRKIMPLLLTMAVIAMLQSCATGKAQYGKSPGAISDNFDDDSQLSHTFFLVGDAGNWTGDREPEVFTLLSDRLKKADSSSTLIFLGDNVYPCGLPKQGEPDYEQAKARLEKQLSLSKGFKGRTVVIPGNHDYYSGLEGVRQQAKVVNDYLKSKKGFMPRKGCPIDHIDIDDATALILIDSEWYLEDWDEHSGMNEDCDIKTRELFFKELEDKLNDYQNKTVIVAMHHPLLSNGAHGGEYSFHKHLYPVNIKVPLPIIGSVINVLRKTSGLSPQDMQNKKYNTLVKRIKTLVQDKDNVVVVSGHDHSLQYIDREGVRQVISGAGSKTEAARAIDKRDFSFGDGNGFAELKVLKNGAAGVAFFSPRSDDSKKILFRAQAVYARPKPNLRDYPKTFPATKDTSVYTLKMTKRTGSYKFFWGKHYREYYSMPVRVRQVSLDTLYGGLNPTQSGGGHQSRSLRLEDRYGREYVMRALQKSATRFLQTSAFRDQSVEKDFRNTYTETFLMDFYTTAHPYAAFVVAELSDDIGINHTNPQLFYIPKQQVLGKYNEEYGDELYLVEERPMDKFKDYPSFGKAEKFANTDDVMTNIHTDEKYQIDLKSYLRVRMFDMLIGDWDRHSDQWRWAEHKENGKVIYRPIPRDRDQAFTKIDGALLSILMNIPALRHMKKFDEEIHNVKWFNRQAYNLDLAFASQADEEDWVEQARYIAQNLSDAEIDKAFETMPKEVRDATVDKIKQQLKVRKTHLEKYARKWYKALQKTVLVVGTEKDDRFVLSRSGADTKVEVYRIRKDGQDKIREKTYHRADTKEIWVYGLGGEDTFEVSGKSGRRIKLRLLGGSDKDTYVVEHGRKVAIYDFKSKDNDLSQASSACRNISDQYELNTYDYKKAKYNIFAGYPMAGFNPDDGVKLGAFVNYTVNGFDSNPFTQKHSLGANYYFATSGYELYYKGTFPKTVGKWNLLLEARYTSPNFSQNFFGFGNETENPDDEQGMDYNRVKIRTVKAAPTLQWTGEFGASANIQAGFERISVDRTAGRFIAVPGVIHPDVFDYKDFVDLNAEYRFDNYDNLSKPTLGFTFSVLGGYKMNLDDSERNFPYGETSLGITYKLTPRGKFVLATLAKAKFLFDDEYEFYQAATVGGDTDLRGFRNQRFAGQRSFYQSTDLRWNIGKLKTTIVPISYGILGGFDYGRVWLEGENSDKWHQTFGGGIWINGVNLITARVSYFQSSDGGRVFAGLGFGF